MNPVIMVIDECDWFGSLDERDCFGSLDERDWFGSLDERYWLFQVDDGQLLKAFIPLDTSGNRLDRCRR